MGKRQFKVEGMMCNHCRANVEKTLRQLEGVTNAEVDLASGIATVEGSLSNEEIIKAITEIGYSVTEK